MRRIPSLWVRLTALAVFLTVILVLMVVLTLKAVRPYREAGVESRRLLDTSRQVSDYERRNATLRRQIAYMNTPDGVISAGHGMGYLRPGEIPLVIEGMPVPLADDTPVPPVPPPPFRGLPPSPAASGTTSGTCDPRLVCHARGWAGRPLLKEVLHGQRDYRQRRTP